ncbi:NAD(P)-binding protein [Exidia glandulosa HHB12029]|uniref:NAD(P)-binding protein n=1 Tax=Exidia glandulosa HHB12029 TaxID=1314781 RepID=A0A165I0V8_EXIGL|nr:NAD(P)-binding protein [Exidia glandulosa HHB12029]
MPPEFQKGWKPPFQTQERGPGSQRALNPKPIDDVLANGKPYRAAGKLEGRAALVTGGDSGIGRATALLFAMEGAQLTLAYHPSEEEDARDAENAIKAKVPDAQVVLVPGDLRDEDVCIMLVERHFRAWGKLDVLFLNHATQQAHEDLTQISSQQWRDVFDTNIHSFFYITKAAVPKMSAGGSIIFNASINPSIGHPELLDYSATKGAVVAYMRALSNQIVGEKGVRVNAVAPGPIWTPLIAATMLEKGIKTFGEQVPMQRAGQPVEVATACVFLASADSSYVSGQVMHVNGGVVIN